MARDEKRYPDASRFMPERFLDINGKLTDDDPAQYVFGHGRRICPGELSYAGAEYHVTSKGIL
jgi:cytochrome P450